MAESDGKKATNLTEIIIEKILTTRLDESSRISTHYLTYQEINELIENDEQAKKYSLQIKLLAKKFLYTMFTPFGTIPSRVDQQIAVDTINDMRSSARNVFAKKIKNLISGNNESLFLALVDLMEIEGDPTKVKAKDITPEDIRKIFDKIQLVDEGTTSGGKRKRKTGKRRKSKMKMRKNTRKTKRKSKTRKLRK